MTDAAPRLNLIDAIDCAVDCKLRAHALEIALRGANFDRDEKNALTALAASHTDQLKELVNSLHALSAKQGGDA